MRNPIKDTDKNLNEASPLLSNFDKLQKISNKEICAVCEKSNTTLVRIKDNNHPCISQLAYCTKCKKNLGY